MQDGNYAELIEDMLKDPMPPQLRQRLEGAGLPSQEQIQRWWDRYAERYAPYLEPEWETEHPLTEFLHYYMETTALSDSQKREWIEWLLDGNFDPILDHILAEPDLQADVKTKFLKAGPPDPAQVRKWWRLYEHRYGVLQGPAPRRAGCLAALFVVSAGIPFSIVLMH